MLRKEVKALETLLKIKEKTRKSKVRRAQFNMLG